MMAIKIHYHNSLAVPFANHFLARGVKMLKYQPLRRFFRKMHTENFIALCKKFSVRNSPEKIAQSLKTVDF